jgi:signal transduction histidine kinase
MTKGTDRQLTLACVADQSSTAAVLHEALSGLFPGATIVRVDTDVERVIPEVVDCAVIDAIVNGVSGIDVLRRLRAGSYAGAAVLVLHSGRERSPSDDASAARLGARTCDLGEGGLTTPLASAVAEALTVRDDGSAGTASTQAVRALRQTQRLLAAGEMALRLQHSLNNPLAALLAEAQLLELEELSADHRGSVERIIELCRRVIDVVRGLDGVGRA